MQLKKLEAYGFKSFADKLDIDFDQGVTAIVGPNGSGKSNITDAIRWVLGEQNVRNLRAGKAEEIIFSGSSSRRSLGVAEVSLTFDNCDGKLPVDFQEVVVTRRLFRSGESEFFINKARCRLKDIYDLFADTGLGKDAISVISQNKIDQVLNSRPEERRLLFEEVAGITKYRNRKRESLKKLDDTQQNILRVEDLLTELESQLGPLAERAEQTRKYNELHAIYNQCKITLLVNRYDEQKHALEACRKQQQDLQQLNEAGQGQIQLHEVAKERLNNELIEVEKSLQLLAVKNNELSETIENNNSKLAVLTERLRQSDENKQRLHKTTAELAARNSMAEHKRQTVLKELEQAQTSAAEIHDKVELAKVAEADMQELIRQAEASVAERQKNAFTQAQDLLQRKNDLGVYRSSLSELATAIAEMKLTKQALIEQDKQYQENYQQRQQQLAVLATELNSVRKQQSINQRQLESATDERQIAQENLQQLNQKFSNAKTRLDFLIGMQEEYEGFGRAVKCVLKNDEAWQSGICGAVAEVINIKNEYITAIEIALGGSLQHVITESDQVAKQAINFLKQAKVGRVTFLPLNTITSPVQRVDSKIDALAGFIGYANKLVHCDAKYQSIIDFLLGRTIIVDNIDTAMLLARQHNYRLRIVTLAGEMLSPGGSMTGGGNARREVGFLNRAGEIVDLKKRLQGYEVELQLAKKKFDQVVAVLEQLKNTVINADELLRQLEIKQAQQKVYAEKTATEHVSVKRSLGDLINKFTEAASKRDGLEIAAKVAEQEINDLQSLVTVAEQDDQNAAAALVALQEEKAKAAANVVELKIAETVADQEIIRINGIIQSIAEECQQCLTEQGQLQAEIETVMQTALEYQKNIKQLRYDTDELKQLKAIGTKDYDNYHQVKLNKLVEIQNCEQKIRDLRKKFNEIQNQVHQLELTYAKFDFEMTNALQSLQTDYGKTLVAARECCVADGTAVLHRRIEGLQREIDSLGAVNPNAISEYETLSKRYTFMKQQADDLILGREYLLGIIKEIDSTMSKQFAEAFAMINHYFSEIFVQLFGGGAAKLEFSDANDILDAGIEISVQPPNKKAQSLAVLSGGERALTVIALLFAFLRFRPAPFSVVDEIDASLDEANVDRFGEFLKAYATNTQFIVVTHRKGTMQVADIIHGVTVDGTGVSKVISVKLADQLVEELED